jgi:hypothetical protein
MRLVAYSIFLDSNKLVEKENTVIFSSAADEATLSSEITHVLSSNLPA